jgi:outer membrane protein TolC
MNENLVFLLALALLASGADARSETPDGTTLTLAGAIERALERAPLLAVARATAEEDAASERVAADAFHPQVMISATPGYSSGLPVALMGQLPAIVGVEVRQTLYDRRGKSDVLLARAKAATTEANYEDSRNRTAQAVAELYGRCWIDGALLRAADLEREAYQSRARRAEALQKEGRLTDLEVERLRLQEARAHQAFLDRDSDRELDDLELRRAVGWAPERPLLLEADLPRVERPSTDDLEAARKADPQLRALERSIESLDDFAKKTGRFLPIVEAEAQYSRLYKTKGYDEFYRAFKADDFAVGLSLVVPVFTGGRLSDAVARTRASLSQLVAERRSRDVDLELRVRRGQDALQRAVAKASLERRAEGVAEEDLRVTLAVTDQGRGDPDDVDQKKIALAQQREESARARAEQFAAGVRVLALRRELALLATMSGGPGSPAVADGAH